MCIMQQTDILLLCFNKQKARICLFFIKLIHENSIKSRRRVDNDEE